MPNIWVIIGVLGAISVTGVPTLLAVWIWTVAIPFMQLLEDMP